MQSQTLLSEGRPSFAVFNSAEACLNASAHIAEGNINPPGKEVIFVCKYACSGFPAIVFKWTFEIGGLGMVGIGQRILLSNVPSLLNPMT
jgi:hypothetical protein